ncbi:AAA family ATPase [Roseovarius aestuariivivens]|uniref:AAA family ATPase n=1 Tax=Roseovarius aestuariivivens TaxID=1888910 RepID=UPI0010811375|nr:ATP-binding protein [Roseovarius aestuariivivens]
MAGQSPVLHLLCGKAASDKSTLAGDLALAPLTVYLAEDDWLSGLYGDRMQTLADYVTCSAKLRAVMGPHVVRLLKAGLNVVLDFPANTIETRSWMREIAAEADCVARLHYLDVSDDVCKARVRLRNASGTHPFTLSDEGFDRVSRYFVPPSGEEAFEIVLHSSG